MADLLAYDGANLGTTHHFRNSTSTSSAALVTNDGAEQQVLVWARLHFGVAQ